MQKFQVADLIPHEKNAYYFDDMTGEKWEEFKESIRTSGVIEPPVITGEMVIVSGHQRIRACKELGITEVNCEVRIYDSEDKVLKDLIETNIRQRGTISGRAKKMGLIYEELKRIYDIRHGGDRKSTPQNAELISQKDIADMMGKSVDTLERFAALKDLIPEFQTVLDEKRISTSVASSLIAKLSEDEQLQLLRQLPAATKLTQAQVQAEVNKLKGEYDEKLAMAEDRLVEAQEAQSLALPDDEYTQVAKERDDAKEQCRTWYEEAQSKKKEIKSLESTLKAKEKEAVELARRLEKAVQDADKKEEEAEQLRAMKHLKHKNKTRPLVF
jgi:ParB family transcriptional regulator, chromosome partitioning protein